MIVIADSGPLIHLGSVDLLVVLQHLFGRVTIPEEVATELREYWRSHLNTEFQQPEWITVEPVSEVSRSVLPFVADLDAGERAALSLAIDRHADLVITDDQMAVVSCRQLHLRVTGTVGVLLEAKSQGQVNEVGPILVSMRRAGFWLSKRFIHEIAASAGETPPEIDAGPE